MIERQTVKKGLGFQKVLSAMKGATLSKENWGSKEDWGYFFKETWADARYASRPADWYLLGIIGVLIIMYALQNNMGACLGWFSAGLFLFFEMTWRGMQRKNREFYHEKLEQCHKKLGWYHEKFTFLMNHVDELHKQELIRVFPDNKPKDLN